MDKRCVSMYFCACLCVYVSVYVSVCVWSSGRAGRFPGPRHDRAITRPRGDAHCGSFHGVLSNTNNCAVKPLFFALLRKVCQLAESERQRDAQEQGG